MGEKGQLFLTEEFKLLNKEWMREIKNYSKDTTVMTLVGKIHA